MRQIHAIVRPDRVVLGPDAFAEIYPRCYLGLYNWVYRTRLGGWLAHKAYDWFARNRLWLTGRPPGEMDACTRESCQARRHAKPE